MAEPDPLGGDPPRTSEGAPGTEGAECKLFVGGISWHMTDSELQESAPPPVPASRLWLSPSLGSSAGPSLQQGSLTPRCLRRVLSLWALRGQDHAGQAHRALQVRRGTCAASDQCPGVLSSAPSRRGFGFVTFDKHSDGDEAVKAIHDTEFDGRKVSVTKAIPQSQTAPGTPASMIGRRGADRQASAAHRHCLCRTLTCSRCRYGDRRYERRGYERRDPYPDRGGYDRCCCSRAQGLPCCLHVG